MPVSLSLSIERLIRGCPSNSPNAEGCLSFSWLAAVARTAHELGAYHIRFAALTRIRRFFESDAPLTFTRHFQSFQENWEWWGRECGITIDVENAIEALNLSRLLLVPFRSPLALYACCLLPPTQLRSGVHAPSEVRSTGPIRNMDAFHEAFGIRPGDPMFLPPAQRIVIW